MVRSQLLGVSNIVLAVGLLAGCTTASETIPPGASPTEQPTEEALHWTYNEADGPTHWGELSEDNAACSLGKAQSPIDLPATLPTEGGSALTIEAEPGQGTLHDTGHTLQLAPQGDAPSLKYGDEEYELLQLHYHAPSEHTVAGVPAAAEFHFVHADEDGELLVLGVLAQEGAESPSWQSFIDAALTGDGEEASYDLPTMLPPSHEHLAYSGSLTTPPCSEGVQWIMMSSPIGLSAAQLDVLRAHYDHTARPVQPLGDRVLEGGSGAISTE